MNTKNQEPELTKAVNLCDAKGNLNPDAIGWSRHPLHHCNLKGHWLRKKQWNYWAVVSPTHLFSVTLSDVDYLGLPFVYILDFESKKFVEKTLLKPFGGGVEMPPEVAADVRDDGPAMPIALLQNDQGVQIKVSCPDFEGHPLEADIQVFIPENHESLNVVIPWSENRFQFTSKQNTLPAEGTVKWGDQVITFDRQETFACLDFGRGMWPYECFWNWSSFSTRLADGRTVGVNLGAGWTDGTGLNENGLCLDGKLFKLSEDIAFEYDNQNFMAPWKLTTTETDRVNLVFTPFFERTATTDALVIRSEVHQMFGRFSGTVKSDSGEVYTVKDVIGWAEDHHAKW